VNDWLDEIVEGLDPAEQTRLRGVHELLVQAGPPPELPPALATLPDEPPATPRRPGRTIDFRRRRRRLVAALAIAGALVAAAFGGGFLAGDRHGSSSVTSPVRAVSMSGGGALAALRVGARDTAGNWPVDFKVTGLPKQRGGYAYYEIFVLRNGKPSLPCAGFRVKAGTTKISFVVPYSVQRTTRWVVTEVDRDHAWPGRVVMT
jgi:hypothetical protein